MANNYINLLIRQYLNYNIPKGSNFLIITKKNKDKIFLKNNRIYDYIILKNTVEHEYDIQNLLEEASEHLQPDGRIIIIYKNYLYSFFKELGNALFGKKEESSNWLSTWDLKSFLKLSDFDPILTQPLALVEFDIPIISGFINRFLINIFPFNHLSFLHSVISRKTSYTTTDKSVTIVIPARNEQGNIEPLFKKLIPIGSSTEVIFIEGHSKDNTYSEIQRCISKYKSSLPFVFKILKQKGIGKAQAVKEGMEIAQGDILIIYDADMSVSFNDINKFYLALITNKGDFINGSRLVYPMEKNAMQFLNILGNKFFSFIYSWILGQKIKDTLCGTKVLLRKNYKKITEEDFFGKYDPFGDFELLLGAGKLNLKIIDLPIRYYERTYGSTNIKRFKNAIELARFSIIAFKKQKMRMD